MKVKELLELLEEVDENAEVRIAYQPNYPLQVSVSCVTDLTENSDGVCLGCGAGVTPGHDKCDCDPSELSEVSEEDRVVWIASGAPTSSGYAPSEAWDGRDQADW